MKAQRRRETAAGLLFVSPWIIGFTVFYVFPAALSLYYSFSDYSILSPPVFIGLENYTFLAEDELFRKAVWNTLLFGALALPLQLVLGLGLAVLVNAAVATRTLLRALFFLPALVPMAAGAILWSWIFRPEVGLLNHAVSGLLEVLGFDRYGLRFDPKWLGDPDMVKSALVLTVLWGAGQPMIIYLAGLQDIPRSFYEVARMDGANWWQTLRHVILPALSPVIYFNLLMGTIGTLQVFTVPYIMTGPQGDPLRAALFLVMYLFDQAFRKLNMGYACAMAWLLFMVIAALTWLAHRLAIRHVHYEHA